MEIGLPGIAPGKTIKGSLIWDELYHSPTGATGQCPAMVLAKGQGYAAYGCWT